MLSFVYLKTRGLFRRLRSGAQIAALKICFGGKFLARNVAVSKGCSFELDQSNFRFEANGLMLRQGCVIRVLQNGQLRIGNKVFINSFCSISCMESISIGDDCIFGEGVRLYDHDHQFHQKGLIRDQGFSKAGIVIGNNCWLGSNVVVLKGVTIGDNCVIGAGCVVFRDVEPNSVIVNESNLRKIKSTMCEVDR